MINRVLIRIKVVQLLYSYLLVENPFTLESQPESPTKEKRFAYNLYLDMLVLMVKLAEKIQKRGGEKPLYDTRFINRLVSDEKFRSQRARYLTYDFPFQGAENELADKIKDSGLYKNFLKSESESDKDLIWKEIFDRLIVNDPIVNSLITKRENYTMRGVDRMRKMVDNTFASFFASADHIPDAVKMLEKSLEKARELYYRLLALCVDITELRARQIDEARHKYLKSEEDINPNLRFVDNEFVKTLAQTPEYHENIERYKIHWLDENITLVRNILNEIINSQEYKEYMAFPATDYANDCKFWHTIYKRVVLRSVNLLEELEDMSVFWNDDLDTIGTFVLKTIRRYEEGVESPMLPKYKDKEDSEFGAQLFAYVVSNKEQYRKIIDEVLDKKHWETERLAFMDVVIVMTAMAEILNFPKIPLSASLYEYIEMAKCYSTPKSGTFVHGLLSDIISHLKIEK